MVSTGTEPVRSAEGRAETAPAHGLPRAERLPRAYLAAWLALAGLSAAYTASVALWPAAMPTSTPAVALAPAASLPADVGARVGASGLQIAAPSPALEAAEERAVKLRAALEDFQRDLAGLRMDFDREGVDRGVLARLVALEERLSVETGYAVQRTFAPSALVPTVPPRVAVAPEPRDPLVRGAIGFDGKPLETGAIESGSVRPAAPRAGAGGGAGAGVGGAAIGGFETTVVPGGAAPTTAGAPPAIVVPAPATPPRQFAVTIGAGGSRESLRLAWSVLAEQHADALAGLEARSQIVPPPAGGAASFELLVGPFRSVADARKACRAIEPRGTPCKVGSFAGDAL
jgi:hypothetical protein